MVRILEGVSVVVVADHALVRDRIAELLEANGASVRASGASDEDLGMWAGSTFEIGVDGAVVDLDARAGAGLEFALALSELRPRGWPWVALRGRTEHVQRAAARRAGAVALLAHCDVATRLAPTLADAVRQPAMGNDRDRRRRDLAWAEQFYGLVGDELACVEGILDERTNLAIARRIGRSVQHVARVMSGVQERLSVSTRQGVAAKVAARGDACGLAPPREVANDRSLATERSIVRS